MGSGGWLRLVQVFGPLVAAWGTFCMVAVHYLRARNERHRDSATEKSADWQRLRGEVDRLDGRCDHLQQEVDDCREREGEWMKRAIAAEAFQIGQGEANQKAAAIVAAERIIDAKKNGGPAGGGK